MATRSVNGLLTSVDSLFTTQQERDEANLKKIYDIPISEIDDFPEHPYQVNDDEDMDRLVESIKERGIITPATVRKKDDGRYELISGHRRKRACELAGLESLRCDIVDLTRDEAIVLMVESNYQRSNILPSEKAFAYKMRLDAMNRQGKRNDLTSDPVGTKLRSNQEFAIESGDSTSQIHRYIRLTTETLQKTVTVEAESREEAEQKVNDAWRRAEYILDAEDFQGVEIKAEDPYVKLTYQEMADLFSKANDRGHKPICGYIVFTEDSFEKQYPFESRTYAVSSNNKAYISGMGGYSIYGSSLDGSDVNVRLEMYMRGENHWKVDYCYVDKQDVESVEKYKSQRDLER